jgi:hypothetical protein
MGKRLRNFTIETKGNKLSDGEGVSGKGCLTDKQIDSLQFYYGKAIRDNVNNLANMKRAVCATFLHKASTDERHQHLLCPKGPNIWCGYNRCLLDYWTEHNINIKMDSH